MFDIVIVGGGIVGLATARAIQERLPGFSVLVLEKEREWGSHQTGRNSGVIHSGIYYRPGSLKARFALDGNSSMVAFCRESGIRVEVCGKVIVASTAADIPRLEKLCSNGRENGLSVGWLSPDELHALEPHAAGVAAIQVPSAGIVDFQQVAACLAQIVSSKGGELRLGTEVNAIRSNGDACLAIETTAGEYHSRYLVNCAGLQSDRVARLMGLDPGVRIVPIRGEYYEVRGRSSGLVRSLIYPVPDPRFPFLGVHLTRSIDGSIHAGPNAVLALSREGYGRRSFDLDDTISTLGYVGLWRLAAGNWRAAGSEFRRSRSKAAFAGSLRRLVPELAEEDLVPAAPGIRAQALRRDGRLVDDFLIVEGPTSLHVCNAPSPAATAAIPIGREVARRVAAACGRN